MPARSRILGAALALVMVALVAGADVYPLRFATRHASGIEVLQPLDIRRTAPMPAALQQTWGDATNLAMFRPELFGHPWVDPQAGEVVVGIASAEGEALAREWIDKGVRLTAFKTIDIPPPQAKVRLRDVPWSVLGMQNFMDEIIEFTRHSGVPGAERIWEMGPDPRNDRVIVTSDRVNDKLLFALAARFGAETIAFRVDPRAGPAQLL
ncbi:MAG TPA: hypothetical protein VGQ86_07400 [Candidatus Limnocylindria bacterium]|nr:hypothetical protein [Candidatus Limnocylindria bacterium]